MVLPLGFRCLTCSLAEVSLSHSVFLASSASLRTAALFLISGGIAKLILQSTALRAFSDISLGAKRSSDSLGALTISEKLLTGFKGHKFDFNFLNPANLNLFYGSGPQSGIWLQNNCAGITSASGCLHFSLWFNEEESDQNSYWKQNH